LSSQSFPSRIAHHLSRVHAITFDVGGTLIQPWPSVGHIYAEVAARHGLREISVDALNRRFALVWRNLQNFNYTRSDWRELVDRTFLSLAKTPLSNALFSDLYRRFALSEAWRIFDDVIATLELVDSRGLKLGIISNWDERLRPLLRRLKLDIYFHAIVVSCETGACKPSSAIFQRAAVALDLPPASILHVGDSQIMDVNGAAATGFQSILLARKATPGRVRISSLIQLLELLK
jgi:putative hydrolase of the HAD superfamily